MLWVEEECKKVMNFRLHYVGLSVLELVINFELFVELIIICMI